MSKLHTYNVEIDIERSDKTNKTFKDLSNSLSDINNISFDNLSTSLNNAQKSLQELYKDSESQNDIIKKYEKEVSVYLKQLEKQNDILMNSLSEQGKADRARLKALSEKANRTKEEEKELKKLQKTTINLSDEEIKKQILLNRQKRITLKSSELELKAKLKEQKINKSLKDLIKSDLTNLKKKILLQTEFIKTLKTTEGRYNAIKKVSSLAMKGASKGAKWAGLTAAGAVGAIGAGVISSADKFADKEIQKRRLKRINNDDKDYIIDQLFIKSGKSYSEIVDAVNRVTTTLKNKNPRSIISAAQAELEFPGASALLQGTSRDVYDHDFTMYRHRLRQLQGVLGASESTIDAAQKAASASRLGGGKFSQTQYEALYMALKEGNAFADDSTMEKFINSFMRQADTSKPIFEQFQQYANKNINKFLYKQQDRNRALKAIESFDAHAIDKILRERGFDVERSSAEATQESLRKMEILKDKLLIRFVPIAEKIFEKLEEIITPERIETIAEFIKKILQFIQDVIDKGFDAVLDPIIEKFSKTFKDLLPSWLGGGGQKEPTENTQAQAQKSMGGLVTSPALVGERGAELVIPLEYSRMGRGTQIINNFNQNFNMSGTQTTALSLGSAVKTSTFARSLQTSRA